MFFLIAGLLCSASVSIVLKYSSRWNYDRYGMLFINYLSCLVPFLILQKGSSLPPIDKDFGNCLLFAIVNGVLYIAGMLLNQINVKRNGAILQSTFARLGVIVPTFLSIIFFGERPAPGEIIGILAVLAAFIIMNIPEKEGNSRESRKPVWTPRTSRSLSRAPMAFAVTALMPLPKPMRMPVSMATMVAVEPTEPRAVEPQNCPTTTMSAILKRTCKMLEAMSGRLKRRIPVQRLPRVISRVVFIKPSVLKFRHPY